MAISVIIERTYDIDLIKGVYFIDEIWDAVTEDGSKKEYFEPNLQSTAWITISDEELLGIYAFDFVDNKTMMVHPMVIPNHRNRSYEILNTMVEWFLETQTNCIKLTAEVPEIYKHVISFSLKAGFNQIGVRPKSYSKNCKMHDVFLYSMNREDLER